MYKYIYIYITITIQYVLQFLLSKIIRGFNPLLRNFFLAFFLRYNLKEASIVYRLIGAVLTGKFTEDPFFI